MRKIKFIKKLISHRRQVITFMAVFVAAIIFGYLGESHAVQTSDLVSRQFLLKEMTRIVERLSPVLKKGKSSAMQMILQTNFPDEIKKPIELGLAKNFPDGSWHLEDNLTRGEAIAYYRRLFDFIKENLIYSQLTAEGLINFEDVKTGHWLEDDLKLLAGTGAVSGFAGLRFFPEELLKVKELQVMSQALIDYFSNNMLILTKGDAEISIFAKGALKELELHEFELSWDNSTWYQMPISGKIPVRQTDAAQIALFFRHPHFLPAGPVELPKIGAASAFVKLRREYAAFVKDNLEKLSDNAAIDSNFELARIKNRLNELKNRHLHQQAEPVTSKVELPVFAAEKKSPPVMEFPETHALKVSSQSSNEKRPRKIQQLPVLKKAETTATIKGKVCDAINNQALEGALLVIDGESQKIGAEGSFVFTAPRHQVVEITVYCEGYSALQMKHRVGYRSEELVLRLKPDLTIFRGRVVSGNQGVAGALIRLGEKATRSNADGSFQIRGIRPGYHQISCFARNFLEAHEIVFVSDKQVEPYSLRIKKEFAQAYEPAQPEINWENSEFREDYSIDFSN